MRKNNFHPFAVAQSEPPDLDDDAFETGVAVKSRVRLKTPPMYKVFLLNDDYTPMDFVIDVLKSFFNKTETEATTIMLHVHRKGAGLCGVYTSEVAETKVALVLAAARKAQHPLQCVMERE